MNLLRVNSSTYQPPSILQTTASSLSTFFLSTWYKRLGHMNFASLKTFLQCLKIVFNNNSNNYLCDSCQRAKTIKIYNQELQRHAKQSYQFIYTNLVRPIKPIGFAKERYFFTFIDDCTRLTETYIGVKKSDWLKCLKIYHNLYRAKSKEEHSIKRFWSDYESEFQSHKANN